MHKSLEVWQASHPVPDPLSLKAGEATVRFLEEIPPESLLINCLSGGTSSLLTLPGEGIPVEELNRAFKGLLNSGAGIHEMNTVRKHLSRVKGGQLLRYVDPSVTLVDLIISDVPGDDPQVIGSGPTTPDGTTFGDACRILSKYKLWESMPESVRFYLDKGRNGMIRETVKPGEDPVRTHRQHIIGSARMLAEKAAGIARVEGLNTWIADEPFNADVGKVAEKIGTRARSVADMSFPVSPPAALIYYGESRVNVKGNGMGGRNQELALHGALQINGYEKITWLSTGTDGVDGPTDAAGAVIDGGTVVKAMEAGLKPETFLAGNNSYRFHEKLGTLLKTGPTGNNLMDLQVIIVE